MYAGASLCTNSYNVNLGQLSVLNAGQSGLFARKKYVGIEACLPPHLIAIVGKHCMRGDVLGQLKAHRGSSDVCRSPHVVLQFCRSTSTSWHAQEPPRGGLLTRGVDFGG